MDQLARLQAKFRKVRHPNLRTAGVIHVHGEIDERRGVRLAGKGLPGVFGAEKRGHIFCGHIVDLAAWLPCALVLTRGDFTVRPDPHSARCADTGCDHLEFFSVRGNFRNDPVMREDLVETTTASPNRSGFRKVEVTFLVRLKVEGKFVEVCGDIHVAVEYLEIIDFPVLVQVDEFGDLVTAVDVNFSVHDLEAEGFKQT